MKFLHVFAMIILLSMSPSILYGNFENVMLLIKEGSKQFGKNNDESNYSEAIYFYKEAIKSLRMEKKYGESKYPIKSSDNEGYVYDAVLAGYQISVSEELAYFLNLNIGKSYVGLCKRAKIDNEHRKNCRLARPFFRKAKILLSKSKYKKNKYTDIDYHLALSHMLVKEYIPAEKALVRAIKINDKNDKLYGALAIRHGKYTKERDYDLAQAKPTLKKAKKLLIKALSIDPERYKYINNLGEIYFRLELDNKAIKYYNEAIFNNPTDPVLYSNRGLANSRLYRSNKNKQKYAESACRDFKIAINLKRIPTIIDAYNTLKLDKVCP